jgi:hypothetical protein
VTNHRIAGHVGKTSFMNRLLDKIMLYLLGALTLLLITDLLLIIAVSAATDRFEKKSLDATERGVKGCLGTDYSNIYSEHIKL